MNAVTRPLFAEGQILSAADLASLASYPRGRDERHNRYLHRWGIVAGLNLETEDAENSSGQAFKRVFVSPGLAIDGEGREILVTERTELDAQRFSATIGNSIDPLASYPVFVTSQFRTSSAATNAQVGPCGGSSALSQIEEGFDFSFGMPGDETSEQVASDLSNLPTTDDTSQPWPIVLGFVQWNKAAGEFEDTDADAGIKHRPYIGINAAAVAGDGQNVQLHPRTALQPGDTVLQVTQDEDGPSLCFGTYKSKGEIECLLKVTPEGNVEAKGTLTGKQTGNSVQVQSGIASDGIILPLPPGVTEEQIADGAAVHVQISPEVDPALAPDPSIDSAALVQECRVDENRRVHCRICWASLPIGVLAGGNLGDQMNVVPGTVRYTIAVSTTE